MFTMPLTQTEMDGGARLLVRALLHEDVIIGYRYVDGVLSLEFPHMASGEHEAP